MKTLLEIHYYLRKLSFEYKETLEKSLKVAMRSYNRLNKLKY